MRSIQYKKCTWESISDPPKPDTCFLPSEFFGALYELSDRGELGWEQAVKYPADILLLCLNSESVLFSLS